jgi:uncharacterized protein
MRWTPGKISQNVEDRRGEGGGMRFGRAGLGLGGTAILLILSLIFGRDFLGDGDATVAPAPNAATGEVSETPEEHERVQFVSFVLDDAQQTWARVLPPYGGQYQDAKLVLFRDAVQSGCGVAQTAMGPFYCPADRKVYIDLAFYDELRRRFGAPGDFAQAYVIAHELGHHVQTLLGTEQRVHEMMERRPNEANAYSVRLELQADCYAGVWGNSTSQRQILSEGDVDEGLAAAAAVGDDRIQQQQTGTIHPEAFTHGSAAQRTAWFRRGLESGDPRTCDTFQGAI